MTARAPHPHPAPLTAALRQEQDWWDKLTTHTANCASCLAARRVHSINGFGCDAGRELRCLWLAASRRRYELLKQHQASLGRACAAQPAEDDE